jgi:hypothetical protein
VKEGLSVHIFCIVRFVVGVKLVNLIGRFSDDQYLPQLLLFNHTVLTLIRV